MLSKEARRSEECNNCCSDREVEGSRLRTWPGHKLLWRARAGSRHREEQRWDEHVYETVGIITGCIASLIVRLAVWRSQTLQHPQQLANNGVEIISWSESDVFIQSIVPPNYLEALVSKTCVRQLLLFQTDRLISCVDNLFRHHGNLSLKGEGYFLLLCLTVKLVI